MFITKLVKFLEQRERDQQLFLELSARERALQYKVSVSSKERKRASVLSV